MTRLTEHFTIEEMTRSETARRKGIDNTLTSVYVPNALRVATALERIRAYYYGKPVRVTSCYRSPDVNKAVGGSPTSAHRYALAADFEVDGVENIQVCYDITSGAIPIDFDQVIYEFGPTGWVHLGMGTQPRHQALTAVKVGSRTVYHPGIVEV